MSVICIKKKKMYPPAPKKTQKNPKTTQECCQNYEWSLCNFLSRSQAKKQIQKGDLEMNVTGS